MKVLTFYFSGSGNTKWTAERFSDILVKRGHSSELISIESVGNDRSMVKVLKDVDVIGFASPLYGANLPKIMRAFIARFCDVVDNSDGGVAKKIIFINTYGYVNGFGIFAARNLFKEVSVQISGYANIRLFNSLPIERRKTRIIRDKQVARMKTKAVKKLNRLIDHLEKHKSYINGIGVQLLIGKVIRESIKPKIEGNYKALTINEEKCNLCMRCMTDCPTKSIVFKEDQLVFLESCTSCMRCYNFCPTQSIYNGEMGKLDFHSRYKGIRKLNIND